MRLNLRGNAGYERVPRPISRELVSFHRAEQMARHLLAHGRVMPPAELTAKVEAVTAGDVRAFAERLASGRPAVAVVGAGKKSKDLAARAERSVGA